jgi:hypothetical protein
MFCHERLACASRKFLLRILCLEKNTNGYKRITLTNGEIARAREVPSISAVVILWD